MSEDVIIAGGGVAFIIGLVAACKPFVTDKRFWPLLGLFFGVALNLGLAYVRGGDPVPAVVLGLMAGLSAGGLYSGVKNGRKGPP